MNKKFALGFLSILAVVTIAIFTSSVSAASTTLVISQAYGGGGGTSGTYMFDYVEIKNISNTQQSLNGLSLMYGSQTGQFGSSAGNVFALPNVTLNPGQYFLVQLSTAGTGGAALPVAPDATTTNLSMSGTNGKVALVTSALAPNSCGASATPCTLPHAAIIDLVSWGGANNAEGGAATNGGAALTATQGNVRKNGGCQDTDNNNADFDVVTAPVPRNSSTTTPCGGAPVNTQHVSDYNGDGKTDFAVVRNTGGGAGGQVTWFINLNGTATTYGSEWGISTDTFVPADYDGDNKSDIAVWRGDDAGAAAFYILQSNGNTVRIELFGQDGDDPTVVEDYDGDGKADPAVYREGLNEGDQSVWYYRGSLNNPAGNVTYVPWGVSGDFPAQGDYDGDGRGDFVVQRASGSQGIFWMLQTTAGFNAVAFGNSSDIIVPGDFDGDGKADIATARVVGGQYQWYVRPSSTGVVSGTPAATFGVGSTDFITPGDYDGDGKTDFAVWRSVAAGGTFWVQNSTGGHFSVPFGLQGDYPPAHSFTH